MAAFGSRSYGKYSGLRVLHGVSEGYSFVLLLRIRDRFRGLDCFRSCAKSLEWSHDLHGEASLHSFSTPSLQRALV